MRPRRIALVALLVLAGLAAAAGIGLLAHSISDDGVSLGGRPLDVRETLAPPAPAPESEPEPDPEDRPRSRGEVRTTDDLGQIAPPTTRSFGNGPRKRRRGDD